MFKTMQKFRMLKSSVIAIVSASMLVACTENVQNIEPTEKDQSSSARVAAVSFNFTPGTGPKYSYNVANMNTGLKTGIVNTAITISRNARNASQTGPQDIDFASWALAIAMQETEVITGNTGVAGSNTEYPWMDSKLPTNNPHSGPPKSGDAANFGVYKMNWYMIRNSATMKSQNAGAVLSNTGYGIYRNNVNDITSNDWGMKINRDVTLATKILFDFYSTINQTPSGSNGDGTSPDIYTGRVRNFWGGHRYGQTGWNNGAATFASGTIAKNNKGWQDTINYWYAVKLIKEEIIGQIQPFKSTTRRIAYQVKNI